MRLITLCHLSCFALLLAVPPVQADEFSGEVRTALPDLKIERIGGFDFIGIDEAGRILIPGSPSLPCRDINIALPTGAEVIDVEIKSALYEELDPIFNVVPSPVPRRRSASPAGNPFIADPGVYGRDAWFPSTRVEKVAQWDLAGQEFVTVRLNPVRYNPVTGKLALARTMNYTVRYQVDTQATRKTYNFSERVRELTLGRLRRMAANPEDVALPAWNGSSSRALAPGDFEYVIITTTSYSDDFEPLRDHYTQTGMPAEIVTTDYIYANYSGGDNPDKIRNFVIDANATWGTIYFLIGGDSSKVPYDVKRIEGDDIPNDTYLADFDDDWKIETYVGRASVDTTTEITTFINKSLDYMVSPPSGFGEEVFFMGFDSDSSTQGEKLFNYVIDHWLPAWVDLDKEYDSEAGGHESDVKAYINSGQNISGHDDHCNWNSLGVGSYRHGTSLSISECQAFSNGDRQLIMMSVGCYPGAFDYSDCWGEEFNQDANGCGIGFVGNTRYGWYMPGFVLSYSGKYLSKFFKVIWETGYNNYHAGEAVGECRNDFFPTDGTYKYCFQEITLLGDPGIPLWTDVPVNLTPSYSASIGTGSQTYTVNVKSGGSNLEGALVCLWKGDEVYERTTTDSSGNAGLTIDPATTGTMDVTITAQNHLNHYGTCSVTGGGQPDMEVGIGVDSSTYQRGDTVYYDVTVTNNTTGQLTTTMWTNVTLPNSSIYPGSGYLNGPMSITVNGSSSDVWNFSRNIPGIAPIGSYSLNAYIGPNPGIDDQDSAAFNITL